MNNRFIFIVDTDKYSGDFERQLCAYITGSIGDCGVGLDEAETYLKKYDELNTLQESDENGVFRPCSIWTDLVDKYNSVAVFFCERPSTEEVQRMKDLAKDYCNANNICLKGFRARIDVLESTQIDIS